MRIKAVHLLTDPTSERELKSQHDIQQLSDFGIEYTVVSSSINDRFCPTPRLAPDRPFKLTPRHFGCYEAHRHAFELNKQDDIDGLLIFECDAVFTVPIEEMNLRIARVAQACIWSDIQVFTFGPKHNGKTVAKVGNDIILISQFIETHAYYIPKHSFDYFDDLFHRPWDALDYVYTVYMYDQDKKRIGTFADRPVCVQTDGLSLITGEPKNSETHWRYTNYEAA